MEKNEIIAKIRKIVGNKRFDFSEAYTKKCGKYPTLGAEYRPYGAVTKKYVYINCRLTYGWNADETEFGAFFHRYSIFRDFEGENVKRVELNSLFTKDLEKILDDMMFFLYWEKEEHLPKVMKEYEEAKKYAEIYDNLQIC